MAERWIVIPRWEEFQHRDADRANVPTWIKTFTRLMSDDAYLRLTFHQRGVLHGIWLEYARARRQLTDSTLALSRRLGQRVVTRDLEALNHAGFLTFSASKPARNHASGLAGTEKRREEQEPLSHPSSQALAQNRESTTHDDDGRIAAWRDRAEAPDVRSPAAFIRAGIASGEWPEPYVAPEPRANTNGPLSSRIAVCPECDCAPPYHQADCSLASSANGHESTTADDRELDQALGFLDS